MASTATTATMAKRPPPQFTDLATAVRNGAGRFVNVIGSVVDYLPPSQSRGTDMQATFTLCDTSLPFGGLRIKYFKKTLTEFPEIRNVGDIVLLRDIKMTDFKNELLGMANFQTQYIVFPKEHVATADYRHRYAVEGEYLHHKKCPEGPDPGIHEQQWVITLKDHFRSQVPSEQTSSHVSAISPAVMPHRTPLASSRTSNMDVQTPSAPFSASSPNFSTEQSTSRNAKEKFSLIQDVTGGDRNGGHVMGNFYDLACEVIKMYFNTAFGVMDLYVCDYTANSKLPERRPTDVQDKGESHTAWPLGRMTLHIELYPPHATWANQHLKEGDFVYLQNVRIKWNQRGLGTELEGNIWVDKLKPNFVCVTLLGKKREEYKAIITRKMTLAKKRMEKKQMPKKQIPKKKKVKGGNSNNISTVKETNLDHSEDEGNHAEEENGVNGELTTSAPTETEENVRSNMLPVVGKKLNPNVKCLHPDVPLSSMDTIKNNLNRWYTTSSGQRLEAPFINVKHHARLRVIDFYPHDLNHFAISRSDSRNPNRIWWEWNFWLVLESGDLDERDAGPINVLVRAEDAEDLLQMAACDLSSNRQRRQDLEQTLFLLWGELAEQKDKFLHAHPHIKPDEFSATRYEIRTDTPPFDTCIKEYGVPVHDTGVNSVDEAEKDWCRVYALFGTRIKR